MVSLSHTKQFEKLFLHKTLLELQGAVNRMNQTLSLQDAARVQSYATELRSSEQSLKLAFIHTYTSELLDPWLDLHCSLAGYSSHVYHAPYGLAVQEMHSESALVKFAPDVTVLLLRQSDLDPDLSTPLTSFDAENLDELMIRARDRLSQIISILRQQSVGQIVVTLLPDSFEPALGLYERQAVVSETRWWETFSNMCADVLREKFSSTLFLDITQIISTIGSRHAIDMRLWYSSKFPFSPASASELARRLVQIGDVKIRGRAKVIVLDADNTLWGGVIGEDGLENIKLGPDLPGIGYMNFQRRLLDYKQRGFILALCSKNNPADVDEVFEKHPFQILQKDDFAAERVNWQPKPQNLKELAQELNVGLDSMIFVDDSDFEVSAVRAELEEVEVIQVPKRETDIASCLNHVTRLEILSLTDEDRQKTRMYSDEAKRRNLQKQYTDPGDGLSTYLHSLKMELEIGYNDAKPLKRLAQLTQKTNQFNFTTKRYDEPEIQQMMDSDSWDVFHFSLRDIFGESGIVGLLLIEYVGEQRARMDTFLMSCRVIGRTAENAFLGRVATRLKSSGIKYIDGEYYPTLKNVLVCDFYNDNKFIQSDDNTYTLDIQSELPESLTKTCINIVENG